MPILKNAKHERFAQGLADGKSQTEAYIAAGYSRKGASASATKLCQRHTSIHQRRDELLAERDAAAKEVRVEVIRQTGIDRQWIIDKLVDVVERCLQVRPVFDRDGDLVMVETPNGKIAPAYEFSAMGANVALKTLAAVTGNLVVRHQHERGLLDNLPPEVVRMIHSKLAERFGQPALAQMKPKEAAPLGRNRAGLELAGPATGHGSEGPAGGGKATD